MKLLTMLMLFLLAGCAPASHSGTDADAQAPANSTPTMQASPAPGESPISPQPARRVPAELLVKDGVNYECSTPADCAIKDIGNCCGYYPACVNKDSPTFPEKVKADCAASGMSSVCGFPSISSCDCIEGRCTGISGPGAGESRVD